MLHYYKTKDSKGVCACSSSMDNRKFIEIKEEEYLQILQQKELAEIEFYEGGAT